MNDVVSLFGSVYPRAVAARFFTAAARVFDADPWGTLGEEGCLGVGVPSLDLNVHASFFGGACGCQVAIVFVIDPEGQDLWVQFRPREEVPPEVRRRFEAEGFVIANPDAYPDPVTLGRDCIGRWPLPEELGVTATLLDAVATFAEDRDASRAYRKRQQVAREVDIVTESPELVRVALRSPPRAQKLGPVRPSVRVPKEQDSGYLNARRARRQATGA